MGLLAPLALRCQGRQLQKRRVATADFLDDALLPVMYYTPARRNNSLTLIRRQRLMRSRLMMVKLCSPRSIPPM